MAVIINARGTSIPYFTIGKAGTTLYQGASDPSLTYTMVNGDYWLDKNDRSFKVWSSTSSTWVAPKLGNVVIQGSSISTTIGNDLILDPTISGGTNLRLMANTWPTTGGLPGQVLYVVGSGVLDWAYVGLGTVSTVSVASTNGFAGTVANPTTTPAITLSTTITGLLKGNGTALSVAGLSDVTSSLGYTPVNRAGDTMTGSLVLNADPSVALGAATKQYVDTVAAGLAVHAACAASTTAALATSTYANGTAGVGATLTETGNGALGTIGGYAGLIVGDRLLVKNQSSQLENGIYSVTDLGSGGTPWILTRVTDLDDVITTGSFTYIQNGTLSGTQWVITTSGTITVGTTAIIWSQLSSSANYTAGSGLTLSSFQFSLTAPVTGVLGGTGQTSYAVGDLLYANTTTTLSKLADVATGNSLISGGVSTAPSWGKIGLTTHVSGTLPVASGGTNLTAVGSSNQILGTNNAGTALEYKTVTAGTAISVVHAANSVTINNTGVTALTAGTNIAVSGATGSVQVSLNGNIPVTNLNSGTSASSTTFWRGDGTWAIANAESAINYISYDNRNTLRSIIGFLNQCYYVENLGIFTWRANNLQPDDDETCFASTGGRWLLASIDPEYLYSAMEFSNQSIIDSSIYIFNDNKVFATSTNGTVFTVPDNCYGIRAYLFGAGGAGHSASTAGGGGGGSCSYGTIPTIPGTNFVFNIQGNVITLTVGNVTYLWSNSGSAATTSAGGLGGFAGAVTSNLGIFDSGSYAGGAGGPASSASSGGGGGGSGSPLGAGGAGGTSGPATSGGGGGGFLFAGGSPSSSSSSGGGAGVGGAGGSPSSGSGAGGGAGGAATSSGFVPGIGRTPVNWFTDPLLKKCTGAGGIGTTQTGIWAPPGMDGGGGGGGNSTIGGNGGLGGGGGGAYSALGGTGGLGGGGGGGGGSTGGTGGLGGGGGGGSTGGSGGSTGVIIFY